MTHTVSPQLPDVADHAAPADEQRRVDAAAVAQYASTVLPGVMYLLGTHVFDGTVPGALQGTIGLGVTALCTLVVRWARRA
jgi:hypothetical protein